MSTRTGTVCSAIAEMISSKQFLLSDSEITALSNRRNELIDGWLFSYEIYRLPSEKQNGILQANLHNTNPRIREQVCDIVGDEFIDELRGILTQLFNDPIAYVSAAARYNHDEMFDV